MSNFTLIVDIVILALGTYGAIILVGDFVELERLRLPSLRQIFNTLGRQWKATLALLAAHPLFILRLYFGLF
jgi:hypothetical protein